ncbi:MAG: M48 family metalloprotease [Rickettsiales bacterium]|nr:M48 family metalloprotease [Rickettsiales bacterium]
MGYKTTRLTTKHAPNLLSAIHDFCKKGGAQFGDVARIDKDTYTSGLDWSMGVNSLDGNKLFLGKQLLKILKYEQDSDGVSDELTAALYHELAHIKYKDGNKSLIAYFAPFAGAAIGILAMSMVEKNQEKVQKKELEEQLSEASPEEAKQLLEQKREDKNSFISGVKRAAKYVAAATLGLGTGFTIGAVINNRMEYKADKFAADMMGSPKPMISTLKTHQAGVAAEMRNRSKMGKSTFDRLQSVMERLFHAPMNNRIERLEAMDKGRGR